MGQKDFLTDRIADAAEFVLRSGTAVFLDFYEPSVQLLTERELGRYPLCSCTFFGGHEFSERKMLAVHGKDSEPVPADYPLKCIQFEAQGLEHRDVLGALTALGIEREKIGDINFFGGTVQAMVSEPIDEFIVQNLHKAADRNIECISVPADQIREREPNYKDMDIIVASMRIDNIMHAVFKMPRTEAQAFVKAEKVKINHQPVLKPSVNVKSGDIISVRTKGRALIDALTGTTKKGSTKLKVRKFQ